MRPTRLIGYLLALALGLGAAWALSACGKSNRAMLRSADAAALKTDLTDVSDALDARDCNAANAAIRRAQDDVAALPSTTSQRLRDQLQRGFDRLARQAVKDCQASTTATTDTTDTTDTTATTDTTLSTPHTTPTAPPTTTPSTPSTPQTTPTAPPATTPTPPADTGGAGPGTITATG